MAGRRARIPRPPREFELSSDPDSGDEVVTPPILTYRNTYNPTCFPRSADSAESTDVSDMESIDSLPSNKEDSNPDLSHSEDSVHSLNSIPYLDSTHSLVGDDLYTSLAMDLARVGTGTERGRELREVEEGSGEGEGWRGGEDGGSKALTRGWGDGEGRVGVAVGVDRQASIPDDFLCTVCAQLLIDPVTLQCGHSFCQLCLAQTWKSKGYASPLALQCPVCRQPWKSFSGVNIQLRNIIERSYPQLVQVRQHAMTTEDNNEVHKLVEERKQEAEGTIRAGQRQRRVGNPQVRAIIILLMFCGLILAVMLITSGVLVWILSEPQHSYAHKPVAKWNNEDVRVWVEGLGEWAHGNYSEVFRKETIDGSDLLSLTDESLRTVGVASEYRRQTILQAVRDLRKMELKKPKNFNEFRAAYRMQTLLILTFYRWWPRVTILYTCVVNYYEVFLPVMRFHLEHVSAPIEMEQWEWTREEVDPEVVGLGERQEKAGEEEAVRKGEEEGMEEVDDVGDEEMKEDWFEPSTRQLLSFLAEAFLIPHYIVARFAWDWLKPHPLIVLPVLVHCCCAMFAETKLVVKTVRGMNRRPTLLDVFWSIFSQLFGIAINFTFWFLVIGILWHVTPYFLCDLIFYYVLWSSTGLYLIAIGRSLLFAFLRRRGQAQIRFNLNIR